MISIIILTYNSSLYIENLLTSITKRYQKNITQKDLEIIVADNGSTDDTVKIVKKFKTGVKLLENGGNLGFAAGINKGVGVATGDILLFVNPDANLADGDLMDVVGEFENSKVGIVGGEIRSGDGRRELSCGKFYTFFNIFLLSLGLEEVARVRFAPKRKRYVDFVSGAFFAIKRDLFLKLGGFDEHFFMYIEDQELCFRVKKEGYQVLFCPFATITHQGQGSSNRTFAVVNIYKGLLYFQKKHMGNVSYMLSKSVLKTKAVILVFSGKILNNQYLAKTYEEAFKVN